MHLHLLDELGLAAAVILLLYLLVLCIIFLAVTGGMAFGFRWVNGKTGSVYGKINGYLPRVQGYVDRALNYVPIPFQKAAGAIETVRVTVGALERDIRAARAPAPPEPVAARPVPNPDDLIIFPP